jgi:uncharacterized protein (DUF1778 family)
MQTTTIRLDDSMKERIAAAAEQAGKSAHAFILDAISQTVEQVELDHEFHEVADERWKGILASGKTIAWDDAKAYLKAKALGKGPTKPLARSARH